MEEDNQVSVYILSVLPESKQWTWADIAEMFDRQTKNAAKTKALLWETGEQER